MSCCTKYIKSPLISFLAGIALGAGSTYYYYTQTKDKLPVTNTQNVTPVTNTPSGKVIIV